MRSTRITAPRPAKTSHQLTNTTRYGLAVVIAIVGVVTGIAFGMNGIGVFVAWTAILMLAAMYALKRRDA